MAGDVTSVGLAGRPVACARCGGPDVPDPLAVFDGSPPLIDCHRCLAAGCDDCEGTGAVPVVAECPECGLYLAA